MRKYSLVLLSLVASTSAFAADCSFKVTQIHKINDCESALGRNCYTANADVVEAVAEMLKVKGYTTEVYGETPAGMEIDLAVASEYLVAPKRGVGYVSIRGLDRNRSVPTNATLNTGVVNRTKMHRLLNQMVGDFPMTISKLVRDCPAN